MTPQVPDELISAYFDGEVTPEERAAVENLLAQSDDAQRDLNETARLSALLHSFPRESAPVQLFDNVLDKTNQLPLPHKTVVAPPPVTRHLRRDITVALASSLATAITTAAVFLIVMNSMPDPQSHDLAFNGPRSTRAPAAATAAPTLDKRGEVEALKEMAPKQMIAELDASTPPAPARPDEPKSMSRDRRFDDQAKAPADSPDRDSLTDAKKSDGVAVDSVLAEAEAGITNFQNPISNEVFLKDLVENKVITLKPQLADPETEVPVVDVAVVDLDKGVDQFLVLLEKLEIRRRPTESTKDGTDQKLKRSEDETAIVFVEAPGDRLAAALNKVDEHPDLYAGWSTQLPLNIANNDLLRSNLARSMSGAAGPMPMRTGPRIDPADAEVPDANLAAEALSIRNTLQFNTTQALEQQQAVDGQPPGNAESRGRSTRSAEKAQSVAQQYKTKKQAEPGYQVLYLQNSDVPPPQVAQRGVVQNNNADPAPAGARQLGTLTAEKQERVDANNRALRLLFVLHPQPEAARALPAAPAKQ